MKKFIHFENPADKLRTFVLVLFAMFTLSFNASAQCALVADDALNVYVDENCQADVYWNQILESNTCSTNPADFKVFIYDLNNNLIDDGISFATIPSGFVGQQLKAKVEYIITGNQSPFTQLFVFDMMVPTIGCYDKATAFAGDLSSTDPVFNRTSSSGPTIAPSCNGPSGSGTSVYYDVQEIIVSTTGSYTFALNGAAAPATQFFVAMYKDAFNPASVCTNFMYDNFAAAAGGNINFTITLTEAYAKYYLVTTSVTNGQTGSYTWNITKPTPATVVYQKKPDCTYNLYCFDVIDDKMGILGLDNCNEPANKVITNEIIYENNCDGVPFTLPDTVFRRIVRTYKAIDPSGNLSLPITVTINISRLSTTLYSSAFAAPANRLVTSGNSLSCSDPFKKDLTYPTHPSPDVTGWPTLTINGVVKTLGPDCEGHCNLTVTYIDMEVPEHCTPCKKRIARTWFINETSCAQRPPRIFVQLIEIADLTPPVVTCPPSVTVNTNQFNCVDSYKFPAPGVTDNCQPGFEWDILIENNSNTPQTFLDNQDRSNTPTRDLPTGKNKITYTLSDKCGNTASCSFDVTVTDQVQPVAICQQYTVVSLTYDGEAQLPAYAVNSGSYDNCSVVSLKIKKMPSAADFADYVTYTCADLASTQMVVLQVSDAAGNKNTCMVNVELQDKIFPTINCPQNRKVDCEFIYDPVKLRTSFGWPTAHDNCSYTITTDSSTVNFACYADTIKLITRNFTVTDNGGRPNTCKQTIAFYRERYFGYNQNNVTNDNGWGQITWPVDKSFTNCMNPADRNNTSSPLHPNQSGFPTLNENSCDQVGYTWSDFVLIDNDNDFDNNQACFKIIRTWTVLDDCHKVNGKFVRWTHDQVLTVTNSVPPVIAATPAKTVCTYDPDCGTGYIELKTTCSDVCTQNEDLRWRYRIDYYNNNTLSNPWDFTSQIFSGNNLDASNDYEIGTHKVLWEVWDQCGNKTIREQLFTINNCKKPTPRCIDGLAVDLTQMAQGPTAVMKAWMFNCCSSHTCDYDLRFSFSTDVNDTIRTFGCNDKGNDKPITLWVTATLSDGTLLQDFCNTTLDVQDNFNLCPAGPLPKGIVSGGIVTEDNRKLEDVRIKLTGSELNDQKTDINGEYKFPPVNYGSSYTVLPIANEDYLNGLSTIDLVIMQKHILGLKQLKTPYDFIASDINNDKKITASDLLQLRKLILGVNEKFDNNKSWRFISSSYVFDNSINPLEINVSENYAITKMSSDIKADFIAVKIGDVSGDVYVNKMEMLNGRNTESIGFVLPNNKFSANEIIEVPVYSLDFNDITGFQGTFTFNTKNIEFAGIESGVLDISIANINAAKAKNGVMPISWFKENALDIADNTPLFVLKFRTLKAADIESSVQMNSSVTRTEAYNSAYETLDISISFRSDKSGFDLLQNNPNPFTFDTEIAFSTDKADEFTLSVYDANGKLLLKKHGQAQKGFNKLNITKNELTNSGVMYYTLSTSDYTATKKMVMLK
ncbi:MAG: HYR domain-containing protein [Deltaproteobacteria bacterium]